jgi:neurotransmitter:Na+ symporter, NSS family
LPYLFDQWGPVMAVIAGVMWFGLLFFAGITSSLAMGTPVMGFLQDEFKFKRGNAALTFGIAVFLMGLPTVLFFNYGVFDEYDYWAGTFALVVFAMFEIILFSWIFGMRPRKEGEPLLKWLVNLDVGWKEITAGADIVIPKIFRFFIKFVTPALLLFVFANALPDVWNKLMNNDLYDKIEKATSTEEINALKNKMIYVNISRLALLAVFLFICRIVYIAYKRRIKSGRAI